MISLSWAVAHNHHKLGIKEKYTKLIGEMTNVLQELNHQNNKHLEDHITITLLISSYWSNSTNFVRLVEILMLGKERSQCNIKTNIVSIPKAKIA